MNALSGLMNPGAVGQSFQLGMEQGRARRGEMETQNALSMLAQDPNSTEGFQKLSFYQPQAAMQMRKERDQAAAAAQRQELTGRAAQGDKRALATLWGVDYETAMKLDDRQLEKATEGFEFIGQAAFAIDALPPEQQAAAFDAYIEQGVQLGFDGLGQYRGQYNPQLLQGIVAKSGEMQPFMKAREPVSFNVEPGAGRYERARDGTISTVIEPNYGGAEPFSPAGPQGGAQPVAKAVGNATYYQNPETGKWYDNAQEAMGGAGGNASGSF